jgi:lysozyme family protein
MAAPINASALSKTAGKATYRKINRSSSFPWFTVGMACTKIGELVDNSASCRTANSSDD